MDLTLEQVAAMAPDAASAAAGKKLAAVRNWTELGRSPEALWGKCQGSALYQVKVDLANLGHNCTCPSRKIPCKHVLGLLTLTVESAGAVKDSAVPEWVDEWLGKRRAREEKQAEKAEKKDQPKKPVDERAQQARAEKRSESVRDGLERLDLWIRDLVRMGLASVESRGEDIWREQAKRLVDAQASGLASRVARLATLPNASPDWAERLLDELGRIKLLVHAHGRLDQLDADLASDVRQMIGWNVSQEELEAAGERVADTWLVAGQWIDDDDRVRAQRSWVIGRRSGRTGLVLQFSAAGQPFPESIVPGLEQEGTLVFYPGAARVRGKFAHREGAVAAPKQRVPGHDTLDSFLSAYADTLARQPWSGALGGIARGVNVVPAAGSWLVRDAESCGLPLAGQNHWKILAVTGGQPCDLAGEWDGRQLRALGMFFDGRYWSG